MPLIAVVARQAFACGGRDLRPGDCVEVSPIEAVVLVTARKATFARPRDPRGVPDTPRSKKRTSKRRVSTVDPE